MDVREVLAESVLSSSRFAERYFAGFDDTNRTRQALALPNHFAWTLGHCALTMHRAVVRLGLPATLPATDFIEGAAAGDVGRFGTEAVCFGSSPRDEPGTYPTAVRCVAIFEAAAARVAEAVRHADPAALVRTVTFFAAVEAPAWHLVPRLVFHNGTHTGQLADLRRALGLPRLFE